MSQWYYSTEACTKLTSKAPGDNLCANQTIPQSGISSVTRKPSPDCRRRARANEIAENGDAAGCESG
jgi:hypothetical protein